MVEDELQKLLAKVHKEITLFEYNEKKIPCIILEEKRFDDIMKVISGKPITVETHLNILQDGLGHVFVEVSLNFLQAEINEKLLLYATESVEFFEALAENSMIALSSPHSDYGKSNVFMIQLPKPERALNALEIIKKGLK